ncbi:MAG: 50S ribosomal protein L2 [Patescibacteria group bacterium]|nr:50S ribosomal protein L2 [Patescibacteria group bacterium]
MSPLKFYKPTTPGRRHASVDACLDVTKKRPEKKLIRIKKRTGGRNAHGKITVRHRGGGAKRFIRIIDSRKERFDELAKVVAIEYDPNRGARLALLEYKDGKKIYIIAPADIKVGDKFVSSKSKIEIKTGNRMPVKYIPTGMLIHDVELAPDRGGKIARGAGTSTKIMAIEKGYAQLRMPSKEIRLISEKCMATIGVVSNPDHRLIRIGKAGRKRNMGIKPTVRGKAMNPVDHPHGGGEGKNPIGLKAPKTPWGKKALGVKTRKKKKWSNKLILKRRSKKKR